MIHELVTLYELHESLLDLGLGVELSIGGLFLFHFLNRRGNMLLGGHDVIDHVYELIGF